MRTCVLQEAGQLVSPCLCKGSMRFVHVECLAQWRQLSANPRSSFQCENCLYRYSYRRTVYASVLRSALVLHAVTLLLLLATIALGSLLAQFIDRLLLNGVIREMGLFLMPELRELQMAEDGLELVSHQYRHLLGVEISYVFASLMVIGGVGFLTLGFVGQMFWRGARDRRGEDTLWLVVIIGVVRAFGLIYQTVKVRSGRMLAKAEQMVLDVGDAPMRQRPAPASTEAETADAPETPGGTSVVEQAGVTPESAPDSQGPENGGNNAVG